MVVAAAWVSHLGDFLDAVYNAGEECFTARVFIQVVRVPQTHEQDVSRQGWYQSDGNSRL